MALLLVAACQEPLRPSDATNLSPGATGAVVASAEQPGSHVVEPCVAEAVDSFAVNLPDPGMVDLAVSRAMGDPCLIHLYPAISIADRDGRVIAASPTREAPVDLWPLEGEILHFELSWSVPCPPRPALAHPLRAVIGFASANLASTVPLPLGFQPTCGNQAWLGVGPAFDVDAPGIGG